MNVPAHLPRAPAAPAAPAARAAGGGPFGTDPDADLRPWLVADLLDRAAAAMSRNKAITLGLPMAAAVLFAALTFGVTLVAVPGELGGLWGVDYQAAAVQVMLYAVEAILLVAIATALSGLVGFASALTQLGRHTDVRELLRLARPSMPDLLLVALLLALVSLVSVVVIGGISLLIGLALARTGALGAGLQLLTYGAMFAYATVVIRLSLAGPVIMLEGRRAPELGIPIPQRVGPAGALRRSWLLVKGKFWRTLGVAMAAGFVLSLIANAVIYGVGLLVSTIESWTGGGFEFWTSLGLGAIVGGGLIAVMTFAFIPAVNAMQYLDLRIRKEGLDLWLRPAMGVRDAPR